MALDSSHLDLANVSVGVCTALQEEYTACREIFDPDGIGREVTKRDRAGTFTCWLCAVPGRHGGHHVLAIVLLHDTANNAAAIGATMLLHHCQNVRFLLMCGIAGAVPSPEDPKGHVRLGDIVISGGQGIVQYDRGKQHEGGDDGDSLRGFECRSPPRPPDAELLHVVRRIGAEELLLSRKDSRPWESLISRFLANRPVEWRRPRAGLDKLIDSPDPTCQPTPHPTDNDRRSGLPRVFIGPIGTANIVLGDPKKRNALRERHRVKAIEMEGSGIADASWISGTVGYLIVRGTCDYCNGRKNDVWHFYAAVAAAAYTRVIVENVAPFSSDTTSHTQGVEAAPALGPLRTPPVASKVDSLDLAASDTSALPIDPTVRTSRPDSSSPTFGDERQPLPRENQMLYLGWRVPLSRSVWTESAKRDRWSRGRYRELNQRASMAGSRCD